VRKDSPKLSTTINKFLKTHRQGTAFGQQLIAKYTGSTYMLIPDVNCDLTVPLLPGGSARHEITPPSLPRVNQTPALLVLTVAPAFFEHYCYMGGCAVKIGGSGDRRNLSQVFLI